jgi:hypothetical protein
MKEAEFPTGDLTHYKNIKDIKDSGFYRCCLFSDMEFPVLPSRLNEENYL